MSWRDRLIAAASDKDVARKVGSAIAQLIEDDALLLELDVNERSISHCLAMHLTRVFSEWDVDCEYNRDRHDPKRLMLTPECTSRSDDTNGSRVYPDIIIHRRNTANNLIVIEMKKSSSSIPATCDLEKLQKYREELGYEHALFLEFRTGQSNVDRLADARWL